DWSSEGYAMNEKGAVWTLDDPAFAASPVRRETARLLALDWATQDPAFLRKHLAHPDQRVRLKAQFEPARRGDDASLLTVAVDSAPDRAARGHVVGGLAPLPRRRAAVATEALLTHLADPDAVLRAEAARTLGEAQPTASGSAAAVVPLLA